MKKKKKYLRRGRPPEYSEDEAKRVKLLNAQGVSVRDIARIVTISKSSVQRIISPEHAR